MLGLWFVADSLVWYLFIDFVLHFAMTLLVDFVLCFGLITGYRWVVFVGYCGYFIF